eukprot:TRINITY_DN18543_c0_g1_i1.p1 TRINITY_DN18543_c0_g1~~TRINITY_DN18543_c0_g1_i1.p1  ORF type:complete len:294 (-),score=2.01 TRINITY_DN18543_c0_g1_i1:79-960(-)
MFSHLEDRFLSFPFDATSFISADAEFHAPDFTIGSHIVVRSLLDVPPMPCVDKDFGLLSSYLGSPVPKDEPFDGGVKFSPSPSADVSDMPLSSDPAHITVFRNEFVPVEVHANTGLEFCEGWRIFVDEAIAYAGNAKRFKSRPDPDEREALILNAVVIGPDGAPLAQCQSCHDYYQRLAYFKQSPGCAGRILLIKSNELIHVASNSFKVRMRFMCCCSHHQMSGFVVRLQCREPIAGKVVFASEFTVTVKPWRRSTNKRPSDHESTLVALDNDCKATKHEITSRGSLTNPLFE